MSSAARVVAVAVAALAALPAVAGAANTDVFAVDSPERAFEPGGVTIQAGDTVTWRWDSPNMFSAHNVFLGEPPQDPSDEDVSQCGQTDCLPGTPPTVRTFSTVGEFPFFCTLHPEMLGSVTVEEDIDPDNSAPVTNAALSPDPGPGGTATGPVTVTLSASDDGGSGLASTEYRIDGGAWTPYASPFTVDGVGAHTVEYRSRDNAGNVETAKQVQFTIQTARVEPPRDTTPPNAQAFVAAEKPDRISLADFLRKGLRVGGPCSGVESGSVRLKVKRSVARQLDLRKPVLARAGVECGVDGRFDARLRPKGAVKTALKRAEGSIRATAKVAMSGSRGSANDKVSVAFSSAKERRGP